MSSRSPSERSSPLVWEGALPATWLLIALLVVLHGATGLADLGRVSWWEGMFLDRDLQLRVSVGGQYRAFVDGGEGWRLATSVLLHGDALHLLVNVLALLGLGRILEPWVGGTRFLAWFALGGVLGSGLSHAMGLVQSDGASGGAFALLGAAAVLGWRSRDRLSVDDRRLLGPVLWAFIVGNVLLSFLLPFVDAAGHLGGLFTGLVLGLWPGDRGGLRWGDVAVVASFATTCAYGFISVCS